MITLLLPFRVYCQENTNLLGNVKDKSNKENLFMAVVGFKEINKWTTCDENGNFEINKIPKGEYTLVVSSLGYKTYQIKISIPFRKENLQHSAMTSTSIRVTIQRTPPFPKVAFGARSGKS